ncbi:MAG: acyl-CoA dehydrogenase family protein [Myxococcota bacterium]
MHFPPFNEEHDQLRKLARDFAEKEIAPFSDEWDKAGAWPHREIFKKLADLGLLGIRFPEEYGGMGLDWWYTTAYVEGLGHARNGGVVMSILVDTDMATPIIAEIGTPEQKQEFLAPLIRGEKIAALGVTEPNCGSDVSAIQTTAKKDGSDYVINGSKTYITNGAIADFITLAVRTGDAGHGGISLVLFPTDTPGFSVGRKLDKLGTRSVDSCELHFDNCRIPQRNLLGHENAGFYYIMTNFQGERLVAALTAIHSMERALHDAIRYGTEREAFGRPIGKFQVWKHKFAEHLTGLEAAKALTYQAVQKMNTGEDPTKLVSMAKLFAGDLAQKVVYDCQQFHGGYGYIEEYAITRLYRDVRLITIGGGTSEVMKEIIWKWTEMGG